MKINDSLNPIKRSEGLNTDDFETNGAGFKVSHVFGYGLLDAYDLVMAAKDWRTVPEKHKFTKLSDNLVPRKPTSPMNSCSERGLSFRDHHCHYECGDGGCCGDTASDCRICRSYISQNGTTCLPQCPSDFTNRIGSFTLQKSPDLTVTSVLVTDSETKCFDDKFEMLMTDLIH